MTGRERQQQAREADAALATIRRMLREADRLDGGDDPSLWTNADDAALYLRGYAVTLEQRLDALAAAEAREQQLWEALRDAEALCARGPACGAILRAALAASPASEEPT